MEINVIKLKQYAAACSVLYVEDDDNIRTHIHTFLSRFFQHIDLAEDGQIGLEKYRAKHYDIIISDINMPNMTGIEMIGEIRKENPEQIVLVTSAYNDSENLMQLINLGVMHFVQKPFSNKPFLTTLYAVAKHVYLAKEHNKLSEKLLEQAAEAQTVIDLMDNGVVMINNAEVTMANQAFLNMGGFQDFDTLKMEMPEIPMLFQPCSQCLDADDNLGLIEQLKTQPESMHKVNVDHEGTLSKFQVTFSQIEGEEKYVLVFTNITAIHKVLDSDNRTGLPYRKSVLEQLESRQLLHSNVPLLLITIKNFGNVLQWYGKKDIIAIEKEAADMLQEMVDTIAPGLFLGYFRQNQFVLFLDDHEAIKFRDALDAMRFSHNLNVKESHKGTDLDFRLSMNYSIFRVDSKKNREEIEVDLINTFESLTY